MENKNIKIKKQPSAFLIIFFLIVLLSIGIFYSAYYYFSMGSYGSYVNQSKNYITQINTENLNTAKLITGQTINSKEAIITLPNIIDHLTTIKNSLSKLNSTNKYRESHLALLDGLSNNIAFYKELNLILANSTTDIDFSINAMKDYKENCVLSYTDVLIMDQRISLPEKTYTFFLNSQSYTYEIARQKKDKEIVSGQSIDFIIKLDLIIDNFSKLNIDYASKLKEIKSNNLNIDELKSALDKNKDTTNLIKNELLKLTVPATANDLFSAINKSIDYYNSYLKDFTYALSNDSVSNLKQTVDIKVLDSLYKVSTDDYAKFNISYDSFLKKYKEFRKNNIQ